MNPDILKLLYEHTHSNFSYTSSMDCFKMDQTPVHISKLFFIQFTSYTHIYLYI